MDKEIGEIIKEINNMMTEVAGINDKLMRVFWGLVKLRREEEEGGGSD